MSRKTHFFAALNAAALQGGGKGSHLTREAREMALRAFSDWCYENNWQLQNVSSIKTKHLTAYVASQKQRRISNRSLQNAMAHLRRALRGAGRAEFATQMSNSALGLRAGRKGYHSPIPQQKYDTALEALRVHTRGAACVLELCRTVGFRREESIRSNLERLFRYREDLIQRRHVTLDGEITKGGKPRIVELHESQHAAALAAIERAIDIARANGGFLIVAADRAKAIKKYANLARRVGRLSGNESTHSCRCSWAQDLYRALRADGESPRIAVQKIAMSLGHGSGRGRWCRMVYLRGVKG